MISQLLAFPRSPSSDQFCYEKFLALEQIWQEEMRALRDRKVRVYNNLEHLIGCLQAKSEGAALAAPRRLVNADSTIWRFARLMPSRAGCIGM